MWVADIVSTPFTIQRLPDEFVRLGYIPNATLLEPGDLILSEEKWTSRQRSIETAQSNFQTASHARWTHAAIYAGWWKVCTATHRRGVHVHFVWDQLNERRFRVLRLKLPKERRSLVATAALARLNHQFSAKEIRVIARQLSRIRRSWRWRKMKIAEAALGSELYATSVVAADGLWLGPVGGEVCLPSDLSASESFEEVRVGWFKL